MAGRVRVLDVAFRANTQSLQRGMQSAAKTLRIVGTAFAATEAAANASDKSWFNLAATVATAFAVGGPVMGGITLASAAVGFFVGKARDADEAWARTMSSMRAETKKLGQEVASAEARLFELQGGDLNRQELANVQARIRASTVNIEQNLKSQREMIRTGGDLEEMDRQRRKFEEERAALLARELEIKDLIAALDATAAARAGKRLDSLRVELGNELHILEAVDDRARAMAEIDARVSKWLATINELQAAGADVSFDVFGDIERIRELLKANIPEAVKQLGEEARIAADSVFAMLDGIFIRGARAADVLRSVAQSVASIALRRGVEAGFTEVFGVESP